MKKVLFLLLTVLTLGFVAAPVSAQTVWDGTADISWFDANQTTFDISTPEQLAGVASLVNAGTTSFNGKTLNLTGDIWLNYTGDSTNNWVPIGGYATATGEAASSGNAFMGKFNGHGHAIYNLYCDKSSYFHAGLFGCIQNPCTIDSLAMVNPVIKSQGMMGAIAGMTRSGGAIYVRQCLVINARIEGTGGNNIGGIVGANYPNSGGTYIEKCGVTCYIGGNYIGGIGGNAQYDYITNAYFAGTLNPTNSNFGGMTSHDGSRTNCYSYTEILGSQTQSSASNHGTSVTQIEMQSDSMITLLGDAFRMDNGINNGYPILLYMAGVTPAEVSLCVGESTTLTAYGYDSYAWSNGASTASITVSPTTTTTYTVTCTLNGVSAVESATVTVFPQAVITASIVPGSDGLAHGTVTPETSTVACGSSDNITLTVTPEDGYRVESVTLNGNTVYGDEFGPGMQTIIVNPGGTLGEVLVYLSKCAILSLPFTDGFETYATQQVAECYGKISSSVYPYAANSSNSHSGANCLYTYMTSTSDNYIAVLPKIFDLNTNPMSSLMISFWAKTTSSSNTITVGVMSDPTDVSTFTPIETHTFASSGVQELFTTYFGPSADGKPYIALRMNCGSTYTYTYVDDIVVDYAPTCSPVTHLTVDNIYGTNASLHWDANVIGETIDYLISVTESGSQSPVTYTTTETDYILAGLSELTSYTVAVQPNCGGGDYGTEVTVSFTTPCIAPIEAINNNYLTNNHTTEGNHFPMSNHYLNSFTEQIYYPSDFNNVSAEFSSLSFQYNLSTQITRTLDIYLAHTADSVFTQNVWATPIGDYVHVYSGPVAFNTNGPDRWVEIPFDSNFYYNGYDNLLLIVNDITGSTYSSSDNKFYTSNTGVNRSQCEYNNDADANWSITNMPATGKLKPNVDNIRLMACDVAGCITPNTLVLGLVDDASAEISWFNPNATQNCEIEYKADGDADWSSTGTITGSSYTLYGLESNTQYQVRVRALCGSNSQSEWSEIVTFRTECEAISTLPYIQDFDGSDIYGSSTNAYVYCWDRYGSNPSEPVLYYSTSAAHSGSGLLKFSDGSNITNIAIMPKVDESINLNELQISFWLRRTESSNVVFELGVMTDKSDPTTFEILDTMPLGPWALIEYSLADYTGSGHYIAFRVTQGNGSDYIRLDDINLDYIPTCAHPTDLVVDAVTSETVDIHWTEAGYASSWFVEYGPDGFTPGEGTVETAYDTFYTIYGLNPNTEYDVYVWADCGGLESTSIDANFRTDCGPISQLPYFEDFETGIYSTSQDNYILCWSRFASDPAHYVYVPSNNYAHSGTHFLDFHWTSNCYNIAIAPELDQSFDVSQLMVNFWACRTGSSGTLEVGVMTDKDADSTFVPVDTIDLSMMNTYAYKEQFVKFDGYQGTGKYIAFRVSNASSCGYYIDDLTIDYAPDCSPVNDLTVSDITGTSAIVSWQPGFFGTVDSYTLEYAEGGTENWVTVDNVTETSYLLGGLNYSTYYDVRVMPTCADLSTGDWVMETFHTNCLVGGDFTIGDGTATNSYLPSYSYYGYSYTQQLFLASEIGSPRSIESVTFDMANYAVNRTYKIYLMHTSETNSDNWIDATNAQLVFDAPQQLQAGLNTFSFSTPFEYNGTDNLLLIVMDMTGSWTNGNTWRTHTAPFTASRYVYQDGSAYSTTSAPSGGSSTSARNNVIFGAACDTTTTCASPNINVTNITSDGATVNWVPGYMESAWEMEYRPLADTTWVSMGTVTSMSEVITGLNPNTTYKVRLRSDCGGGEYSLWAEAEFTTDCGAFTVTQAQPWFENFETNPSAAFACWETPVVYTNSSGNTYPKMLLNYGEAAHSGGNTVEFKGSTNMLVLPAFTNDIHELRMSFWSTKWGVTTTAVVGVITDLADTSSFEVLGDAGTPGPRGSSAGGNGNYMGPFDFNNVQATSGRIAILFTGTTASDAGWNMDDFTVEIIPDCPAPAYSSVTVDNVTAFTADVSFTDDNTDHNAWVIYYGVTGTSTDTWNSMNVTSTTGNTITGLTSNTNYSVYVVTMCNGVPGDDQTGTVTFTTLPSCPVPTGLTISGILAYSADVYWVPGATETQWELEYGLENFTIGSGTNVTVNGTAYYQLQNLLPNTKYDVYVRAVCGTNDMSEWTAKETFRTACDAYQLPLMENFDSYADWYSPDCWKKYESANMSGYAYIYSTQYYSGTKSLQVGTNSSSSSYGYVRLPLLDVTSLNGLQISFMAKKTVGSTHPLQISVSDDFNSIDNITVVASIDTLTSDWTQVTVPFASYTGTGMYILIGVPSGYSESCTYWVDDVVVNYADTTGPVVTDPTVTTAAATNISQTGATLNGSITNPDNVTITAKGFEWRATAGGAYTPVTVTGATLTHALTGLTANTGYTFRAFITFNGNTVYGNELTFTTLPDDTPEPCDAPTGLDTTLVANEVIGITWDANANVSSWNVHYRPENGEWTSATTTNNGYTITGLTGNTTYEIQVQANCGDGNLSDWSASLFVTTKNVGINSWLESSVTLYPNPAREYVDIRVDGDVNMTSMEVYDVYGKLINTVNVIENPARINVSGLANGMYFVRVTTEQGAVTKTFVKK